jgi:hypothetical protein
MILRAGSKANDTVAASGSRRARFPGRRALEALLAVSPSGTMLPVRIYTHIDPNYGPPVTAINSFIVILAYLALALIERTIGIGRLFGLR